MSVTTQQAIPKTVHDEHVLVVKREALFTHDAWQGLNTDATSFILHVIEQHHEFQPRSLMEQDPRYKQIIPYVVFTFENKYFVMQRQAHASEQRLKSKFSLGVGGHMRQTDLQGSSIFDWAQREFHEEVSYCGALKITPLGVINDDSDLVGQVHLGLVLLIEGDNADITIKSELKSGQLLTLDELNLIADTLENWSSIVLKTITKSSLLQ